MRLSEWLDSQNINQSDFAERVGTTGASISRIVAGTQWPSAPLMAAIEAKSGGAVTAVDILAAYTEKQAELKSQDAAPTSDAAA